MDDDQLLRYSRQILLRQVDIAGQERLLQSRVLIIGLGGLGSPTAMYLTAAGVGDLVIVDFDKVDLTNLQRQIVHTTAGIGRPKAESAAETLRALNPEVRITPIARRLEEDELTREVDAADVVIDATDNFEARVAVNRACLATRTPMVYGAAVGFMGQVAVFRTDRDDGPCYQCVYPRTDYPVDPCSQYGVFTPLVGIIGSTQANEALKLLLGIGEVLTGRMLLLDAEIMDWTSMQIEKNPACPACPACGEKSSDDS